jgi:hypothetical protein
VTEQIPAVTDEYGRDPRFHDFRNFLFHVWTALGYPEPTDLQYDYAQFLQYGGEKVFASAYRGFGKTWIAVAFGIWTLYWASQKKVMIVSASKDFALNASTFAFQMIDSIPELAFLSYHGKDRHSKVSFDVGPALPHRQPSWSSIGITGQVTGNHVDLLISDDVETLNNSLTQGAREILSIRTKEYAAVLNPGGQTVVLGTYQSEESVYLDMVQRGYRTRLWPIEYPEESLAAIQTGVLAPLIIERLAAGAIPGAPTDPMHMGELQLAAQRAEYGAAGYALQFKLNTTLSDLERYPLKLRDLIVMSVPDEVGPEKVIWTNDPQYELKDLLANGLGRDRFFGPIIPKDALWSPWQGVAMWVDPSGTGSDETGYAIVKCLNGVIYVAECTGLVGGYEDGVMIALAGAAKRHRVNRLVVESNFGDGMFERLLQPHLVKVHPCPIESVKVTSQKERRILDVLEPVMQQHRLAFDRTVFERDGHRSSTLSVQHAPRYLLAYQMTRLTRERGCLAHDDRVDALSGAVSLFTEAMAKDVDLAVLAQRAKKFDDELEQFVRNGVLGRDDRPRYRSSLDHNRATRDGRGIRRR